MLTRLLICQQHSCLRASGYCQVWGVTSQLLTWQRFAVEPKLRTRVVSSSQYARAFLETAHLKEHNSTARCRR